MRHLNSHHSKHLESYPVKPSGICLSLTFSKTWFNLYYRSVTWSMNGEWIFWKMLQAGRLPVRVPNEVDFFNLPNPSSRTMALVSTQPLTKMSTRNLPGGKNRPATRADNLAAICEPNVWKYGSLNLSNPKGLHGLYRENSTFALCWHINIHSLHIVRYPSQFKRDF
jgi:hypothetical protein